MNNTRQFLEENLFPKIKQFLINNNTLIGFFDIIPRNGQEKIKQEDLNILFEEFLFNININTRKYKLYCTNNYTDFEFRISYGTHY